MTGAVTSTAVVFVNYHSERLIVPRARALLRAGFQVVVADNSASFPREVVDTIAMPRNQGFGAGCNAAVQALDASVRVIVFHNPDVDAAPGGLQELVRGADSLGRRSAVAPAEHTGRLIRQNGYRYPGPAREALLAARAAYRLRGPPSPTDPRHGPRLWPTRLVSGGGPRFAGAGLLVVTAEAFAAVGGFDERYFLYGEDLDLWHRLHLSGAETVFRPDVVVRHDAATGSPMAASTRELLRWLGVEMFAQSFHPAGWRRFRRAHRPFLRLVDGAPGGLGPRLAALWARDLPPSGVLAEVRGQSGGAALELSAGTG